MVDKKRISQLANDIRKHLLNDIIPFWESRTKDNEYGGCFTCFDREGNITDTDKYIWFQGRQVWMFSALYNRVEKRSNWLELASHGRDFLVNKAYGGEGRWNYQLDRQGNVKQGKISIYTDFHVLEGICEFAVASRREDDLPLIKEAFDAMESNIYDLTFKDIYDVTWSPRYKRHGIRVTGLQSARIAEQVLGKEYTRPLIDYCLEQLLYVFAKDDLQLSPESVSPYGAFVNDGDGRVVNPGHILEGMWFCIHEGKKRDDRTIIERAIQIADWGYQRGYDTEYGGIFAYLDAYGAEPIQYAWYEEVDMSWDDKSWWVQAETLYALALIAIEKQSEEFLNRFTEHYEWCRQHFFDPEFGEWYTELYRDCTPKLRDKGTLWKAAYHLPRALMLTMLLFEKYVEDPSN